MADNIIRKRVDVAFTKEEYKFLEWLAEREDMTVQNELKHLLYSQYQAQRDLYLEEMEFEQGEHHGR